jgi:glycosyltransferase involved in cell wall biosynthesis
MQKIVVMPVRNEAWILPHTLPVLSAFADHIIVADQQSTDATRSILHAFPKVRVIDNPATFHTSNVRKLLLAEARTIPGHNAIFSFDADELPTAAILSQEFHHLLKASAPGTAFAMEWVQLWRSTHFYRHDHSVWTNNWKYFGFIDDRQANYDTLNVINDHTHRIPAACLTHAQRIDTVKVLHYQFVDFARMLAKQRLYRLTEFIQRPGQPRRKSFVINTIYADSKNEHCLKRLPVPREWLLGHEADYHFLDQPQPAAAIWYETEAAKLLQQCRLHDLQWLDIWDTTWPGISDPRSLAAKAYHASYLRLFHLEYLLRLLARRLLRRTGSTPS